MSSIHVCSLELLAQTAEETGARSLVTLLDTGQRVWRPKTISPNHHICIGVSDFVDDVPGCIALPQDIHVRELLEFVIRWDRVAPLLIHCAYGISRSTAAAFISVCALSPRRDEKEIALALRAASPSARPNTRLIALADTILYRSGNMNRAIEFMGPYKECFKAKPFMLNVE